MSELGQIQKHVIFLFRRLRIIWYKQKYNFFMLSINNVFYLFISFLLYSAFGGGLPLYRC